MHVTTIFLNMWISIFLTGLFDWNAFMFPVGVKSVHFRFGKILHREGAFFFWFSSYTRCFLRQISDLVQVELKMVRQIAWREGSVKKVVDRRNVHNIMTTTLHRVECVEKCGILWKCVERAVWKTSGCSACFYSLRVSRTPERAARVRLARKQKGGSRRGCLLLRDLHP